MPNNPYNKTYRLVMPDGTTEDWTQEQYDAKRDKLYAKYKDVDVYSQVKYHPDSTYSANSHYLIDVDGNQEVWTPDMFAQKGKALKSKYPKAKISVITNEGDDYWSARRDEARKALADFDSANGAFMAKHQGDTAAYKEGVPMFIDEPTYIEQDARYNQLKAERDRLESDYNNNPLQVNRYNMGRNEAETNVARIDAIMRKMIADRPALKWVGSNPGIAPDEDYDNYAKARKLEQDIAKIYSVDIKNPNDDFGRKFANFLKGHGDTFSDADFWSRGLTEIDRNMQVRSIFKRLESKGLALNQMSAEEIDANLTDSEKALVGAFLRLGQAMSERRDDMAAGYNAGKTSAESLGFMAEFLLSAGIGNAAGSAIKGGVQAGSKMAGKGLMSWLGRELRGEAGDAITNKLTRVWLNKAVGTGSAKTLSAGTKAAISSGAKAIGKAYDYAVHPLIQALWQTPLMPSTYRTISEQLTKIDNNGVLVDAGDAIFTGYLDSLIETWSESMGGAVDFAITAPWAVVGKAGSKALGKTNAAQWAKWLVNSKGWQIMRQGGFNGIGGEMGEEWLGNAVRLGLGLIDKDEWDQFKSLESQLEMAAAFAPMSLVGCGSSAIAMAKNGKHYKQAAAAMQDVLKRKGGWSQEEIDNLFNSRQTREDINKALTPVLQKIVKESVNDRTAAQDYRTVLDFAQAASIKEVLDNARSLEQGKLRQQESDAIGAELGATSSEDTRGKFSYNKVYDTPTGQYEMETVTELTDARGAKSYIVGEDNTNYIIKDVNNPSEPRFLTKDRFQEMIDNGELTANTSLKHQYLDTRIDAKRQELARQLEDKQAQDQINAITTQLQPGTPINVSLGDTDAQGVVMSVRRDGVVIDFGKPVELNGVTLQMHKLSLEQAGRIIGVDAKVKTQEQMDADQIAADELNRETVRSLNNAMLGRQFVKDGQIYQYVRVFDAPAADEQGNKTVNVVATDVEGNDVTITMPIDELKQLTLSVKEQANVDDEIADKGQEIADTNNVERDFRGNEIPMRINERTGKREVDKRAFKERDPEAYYRWNDAQRGGNMSDSMEALQAEINAKTQAIAAKQQEKASTTDPELRDALEQEISQLQGDANLLAVLYHQRDAATNFQSKQADFANKFADIQERLLNAKTQTQVDELYGMQRDLMRDYASQMSEAAQTVANEQLAGELQTELNKIADVPVLVSTYARVEQDMRNDGATEAQINKVLDKIADVMRANMLNGTHNAVTGVHNEGKVYIFADACKTIDMATTVYYHERQHHLNKVDKTSIDELAKFDTNTLYEMLGKLIGNVAVHYEGADQRTLADELMAFGMQRAYTTPNWEDEIRSLGLGDDFINILKTEYGKQQGTTDAVPARSGDGTVNVSDDGRADTERNGATAEAEPGNEQLGTAQHGNEARQEEVRTDNQGNLIDSDGNLVVEEINSIDELTDVDFINPYRSVRLPRIPDNVDAAIGANGKPVIIKKNIFEKNNKSHTFSPSESRAILTNSLYNTDIVGRTNPSNKPYNWVAIQIDDRSPITVLEVNQRKENVEIIGWYTLDERNLARIERQAKREGGELLILTPKGAAASLSTLPSSLSSANKVTNTSGQSNTSVENSSDLTEDQKTAIGILNGVMPNITSDVRVIGVAPKVKKNLDLFKFVLNSKDPNKTLTGVYHDKGMQVASTATVLVALKSAYPSELEGKVTDKKGNVITDRFPAWRKVVSGMKDAEATDINPDELAGFLEGVKSVLKKRHPKASDKVLRNSAPVRIMEWDGKGVFFSVKVLEQYLEAARSIGGPIKIASINNNRTAEIITKTGDNLVVAISRSAPERFFDFQSGKELNADGTPVEYDEDGNPSYSITEVLPEVRKEMDEIIARAKADGTYLKAPNGKDTKLSPEQWAMVRTERFKKWFGDWEKAARIERLRNSTNVSISGKEIAIGIDYKETRRNALEYGKALRGEYTNKDTGYKFLLVAGKNGGVKEVLEHDYKDIPHLLSIAAIPQIAEESIYIDSVVNEDLKKHPNVVRYDYYVCGLTIGNEEYTVKAAIAVTKDGQRYYDHKLTDIEKGKLIDELANINLSQSGLSSVETSGESNANYPAVNGKDITSSPISNVKDKRLLSILQINSSKVVDENGEPMVVYHGGKGEIASFEKQRIGGNMDFGTMGAGFYFTSDRQNAENYARNAEGEGDTNVTEVFLNIRNPKEVKWNHLSGENKKQSETYTSKLRSDGYDGSVAKAVNGATWYMTPESTQIKSATDNNGEFSSDNPDIRFGIEEIKSGDRNLVALHNLKEQDLLNAFELGGFPMPSIAITKAEVGHTDFGDISLVFDKNSIDPRNRKNKVYGGDAWTPMFPKIVYKLNYDKTSDIYRRAVNVGELPMFNSSNFNNINYEDNIDDTGESGLINSFKDDYGAKQFFLAEQGNPVLAYETKEADKYDARTVGRINELLNTIGLENLKKQDYWNVSPEVIDMLRTWFDKLDDKMLNRVGRNYVQKAIDYAENGNKKTEVDYEATRRKIDEMVDTVAFEKWLEDMFSGIVEKRGIRNEVDLYTPSGNRRPFEKLYDDITLDNVVNAMSRAPEKGGSGFFHGNIFGAASGTFGSLTQIREAAKQRIESIEPSEMEKDKKAIIDRLSNVRVTDKELDITEMFDLTSNIQDAVAKTHTPEGIYKYLKEFYPDTTMEAAQEIADIVKDIQQLSTRYFEAKPQRAVSFEEVKLAVVPEGTRQDVLDGLQERGIDVRTYEKDNQQQRKDIVSESTQEMGLRFNIANVNQSGFISNALASLDKIPMKQGNAQAWINKIQQAGGLKKEEDKWIGLTDWLNEQDGNITKADVAEYIREHQVRIEDVKYGESVVFVKDRLAKKYGDIVNEAFQIDEQYGEGDIYVKDLDKAIEFYNSQNTITPILDSFYMDEDGEVDQRAMEDTLVEWMSGITSEVASENENREIDRIRLQYTTGGLVNNREIALVVPDIDPYNGYDQVHFGDAGSGRAVAWARFGDAKGYITEYSIFYAFEEEMRKKYFPDRTTISLNKTDLESLNEEEREEFNKLKDAKVKIPFKDARANVLVIDEIQSKRHQDAKELGYKDYNGKYQRLIKESNDAERNVDDYVRELQHKYGLSKWMETLKAANYEYTAIRSLINEDEYNKLESLKKISADINDKLGSYVAENTDVQIVKDISNVPDAPFRESWDALAMKRMLRLAAEEGYDRLAWTNGKMQSDRYGLTKVLEDFYYKSNGDGTYKVSAALKQRRNGYEDYSDINYDSLTAERIGEIFGKEIAGKVSEGKGRKGYSHNNEGDWITFKGRDLKVSNEGMRYFYDQKLVNWMNKYCKKWGVQVEDLTLYGLENKEGWHSVDITPEMKSSIMQGQPMFSITDNDYKPSWEMTKQEVNKVIDKAISIVNGLSVKEVAERRKEEERQIKEETTNIYSRVLNNQFDDITLQLIDNFIANVTPDNQYRQPLSKRLPPRVGRALRKIERNNAVDGLFTRIAESTVREIGSSVERARARREVEKKKQELLKGWAIATGNWHTSVSDFTNNTEPIGQGKDSIVYNSDNGNTVIKVSFGKDKEKKFSPDIDAVNLFNAVFPNSRYSILGYGEIDGKFVKFLQQPSVRFSENPTVSVEDRVEYMRNLGFKPINKEQSAFSNGELVVADLQKGNIVRDVNGEIRVIDADVKLHTKDIGGNYSYPPASEDIFQDDNTAFSITDNTPEDEELLANEFDGPSFHILDESTAVTEDDRRALEAYAKGETTKVFRSMQRVNIDGVDYALPPMAAKVDGQWVPGLRINEDGSLEPAVLRADEQPEKADKNGKYKLDKGNGKSLPAAYNPYWHTSFGMLNDQFSEAQDRDNLITVEGEIPTFIFDRPKSEAYKADKAKDAEGPIEWKAGIIQSLLTGTRQVILSRYFRGVRVVPDSEVARNIYEDIKDAVDYMPTNVVPPAVRKELESLGVKFIETDNQNRLLEGEHAGDRFTWWYNRDADKRRAKARKEAAKKAGMSLWDWLDEQKQKQEAGPEFSIIGEKGAAALDKAEEASIRLDNLAVAREMENSGKDALTIKRATGWERGADGKWRYEIPDGRLAVKSLSESETYTLGMIWDDDKLFEAYPELRNIEVRPFYGVLSPILGAYTELTYNESEKGRLLINTAKDFLDKYPTFDDYKKSLEKRKQKWTKILKEDGEDEMLIEIINSLEERIKNAKEAYDNNVQMYSKANSVYEKYFSLNIAMPFDETEDSTQKVLAHEIQHAIQIIEGFAVGGNTKQMQSLFESAKKEQEARIWARHIKEESKEKPDATPVEILKVMKKELRDSGLGEKFPDYEEVMDKGFNYYVRGYADKSMDELIKKFKLDVSTGSDFDAFSAYSKLAGEVESRNVETRLGMSEEERKNSLLADTEDVSREDQIFLYEAQGKSSSESSLIEDLERKRKQLQSATPIKVDAQQIVANEGESGRNAALRWFEENVGRPLKYNTEVGEVTIDRKSIKESLSHGYSQSKLDAITSLPKGFANAVYLTSMKDFNGKDELNHYFVYPIYYEGNVRYVLCRVKSDVNRTRLYIHEVYPIDAIKGPTLQTAAGQNQPHRGKSLYLDLLKEVLYGKDTNFSEISNTNDAVFSITNQTPSDITLKASQERARLMSGNIGRLEMFDTLLDVYNSLPEDVRGEVVTLAPETGYNFADATAQFFARLANKEELDDKDIEAVSLLRDVLYQRFGDMGLTLDDTLWAIYNNTAKETDLLSVARRTVVADKLGHMPEDEIRRNDIKDGVQFSIMQNANTTSAAQMYNEATSFWVNRLKEGYVDMYESVNDLVAAIEKTTGMNAQSFEDVRLALNQQSSKGLDRMSKYIETYLNPLWDAIKNSGFEYNQLVRYVMLKHSLERNDVFAKRDAKRYYKDVRDSAVSELNSKMKEANARLKEAQLVNDANAINAANAEIDDIKNKIDEANKELDDQLNLTDAGQSDKYNELRENDYSGLMSMFAEYPGLGLPSDYRTDEAYQAEARRLRKPMYKSVSDAEAAAADEVDEFEKVAEKGALEELWKRINAATKETLKSQYDSNVISKQQYEHVRDMFEYYVPLRGFTDVTAEDIWSYVNADHSGSFSPALLNARGRKSQAEDPFIWIGTMASSAIAQNVKNESKLALYYFVSNRPNQDLVSVRDVWYEYDDAETQAYRAANPGSTKKVFKAAYPDFTTNLNGDASKQAYDAWDTGMKVKEKNGLAYRGKNALDVKDDVVFISDKEKEQHTIRLKVRGKQEELYINGNPRAAQAMNGLLNVERSKEYSETLGKVLRWMASVNTSYNPEFWISNAQRDLLFAFMSSDIKGDGGFNLLRSLTSPAKIMKLNKAYKNGTLGNTPIENYFREFAEGGAITGFTVVKGNEVWEKEIQDYLQPGLLQKAMGAVRFDKFLEFFQNLGEAVEQMTRFAAFINARESGKSIDAAVNDAKEISVNFNRKGSGQAISKDELDRLTTADGKRLNGMQKAAVRIASFVPAYGRRMIMFFNAAVQGLNAMYKLWKTDKRRTTAWMSGFFAVGAINALIHALLDDDDDYLDMPDFTRRNNLLVGGGGVYFKWALPQEARIFYAMGDMSVGHAMGRYPHKNLLGEMANAVSDVMPLSASEGVKGFAPSVLQPVLDIITNRDYTGGRVYNDLKFLSEAEKEATPRYAEALKGTDKIFIDMSQVLNILSGGDEYDAGFINIPPEVIQHIAEQYAGGMMRTVDKAISTAGNVVGTIAGNEDAKELLSIRRLPFISRVLELNDERTRNTHIAEVFYYYRDESDKAAKVISRMKKAKDTEALEKYKRTDDYKIWEIFQKYKKTIKLYNDNLKAEPSARERKRIMREQDELRRKIIDEISRID